MNLSWQKSRYYLLIIQLTISSLILLKLFIAPTIEQKTLINYTFPTNIPLSTWQLSKTEALSTQLTEDKEKFSGEYISGQKYQYLQQNFLLNIEMRYFVKTNGYIKVFLKNYPEPLLPILHQEKGIGFYTMSVNQQQASITSCINPNGYATVTTDQFRHNDLIQSLKLKRILTWLTSQEDIMEKRCMWVNLSMPLNNYKPEYILTKLETIWLDWHRWWSHNFPQ